MTIEEKLSMYWIASLPVSTLVWSDNIHLQMNDDANNYVTSSPMITYAEIDTSYSKAKVHWMYQVTVLKQRQVTNSIAEDIRSSFDMTREPDYNFTGFWEEHQYLIIKRDALNGTHVEFCDKKSIKITNDICKKRLQLILYQIYFLSILIMSQTTTQKEKAIRFWSFKCLRLSRYQYWFVWWSKVERWI